MSTLQIIGLVVQLAGTALAGWALIAELRDPPANGTLTARRRPTNPHTRRIKPRPGTLGARLQERDQRAYWKAQEAEIDQLHEAAVDLLEHARTGAIATRRRVLIEMTGLVVVAIGTIIGSFG